MIQNWQCRALALDARNLHELLCAFFNRSCRFYDESVNSTFRDKTWQNQKGRPKIKNVYKLGSISVLGVPDIIDYKLELITRKFKTTDPI